MGTAPRKQLAAVSRKQPKRSYKIPRSLKKGIKRNLVKIVKDLHAEHLVTHIHHETYHIDVYNHLDEIRQIWQTPQSSDQLRDALKDPLSRMFDTVGLENVKFKRSLPWEELFSKGIDMNNVEQPVAEHEDSELKTGGDYDWTSTSTLE